VTYDKTRLAIPLPRQISGFCGVIRKSGSAGWQLRI